MKKEETLQHDSGGSDARGEKSFVSAVQIWCGVSNTASSTAFNNWLDKETNTKADKNTKTDKNIKTDKKTKTDKRQLWVEVDWVILYVSYDLISVTSVHPCLKAFCCGGGCETICCLKGCFPRHVCRAQTIYRAAG